MKPTQLYLLLFSILILVNCQKKEINIPTSTNKGIQAMTNYSEIWMFKEIQENDTLLKLNDHNLIGATNWVFNIDKHLKLKIVLPKVNNFQEKRLKRAEKNKNEFKNYLSYSDTNSKILSFVDLSNVQFHFDTIQSKKHLLKNLNYYKNFNNFHLSFGLNSYYLNETKMDKTDFFKLLSEFINFSANEQTALLHLNYNQELTYQEYVNIKTELAQLLNKKLLVDNNEYIFDAKKVPECGCEL